jgi:hypothetical protein
LLSMGFLKRVVEKRASGDRPSPPVAAAAAVMVGAAAAVVAYRLLRAG